MKNIYTFLVIFLLSFLVSCNDKNQGTITQVSLEKAHNICQSNGGLKQIHSYKNSFQVVCENGAVLSQKVKGKEKDDEEVVSSKRNPYASKDEVKMCESLCDKNTGLKQIELERGCTNWVSHGRSSTCEEYADIIKCVCQNNIELTGKRVLKYTNGVYE